MARFTSIIFQQLFKKRAFLVTDANAFNPKNIWRFFNQQS